MPEASKIRRAADRIAAVLEGQLVEQAWFGLKRLQRFGPELSGARVDTRGKPLLMRFTNGLNLYAHNQVVRCLTRLPERQSI